MINIKTISGTFLLLLIGTILFEVLNYRVQDRVLTTGIILISIAITSIIYAGVWLIVEGSD